MTIRVDEYKRWLEQGGARTKNGRNVRVHGIKTIEKNLTALGLPYKDLDEAWADDEFEALDKRLKEVHEDARAGGQDYRILMPDSDKPNHRLQNWRSWLRQYGRFLAGDPAPTQDTVDASPDNERKSPMNLILHGPPGTGKTYTTAEKAIELCGEPAPEDRAEMMKVYHQLTRTGRIEFVTFHQSMSYEDFVEGRQPTTEGDENDEANSTGFRLETVPGIFRRIARRAEASRRHHSDNDTITLGDKQVFKMSLGRANVEEESYLFDEAIEGGYALMGGSENTDWSNKKYSSFDEILRGCQEDKSITEEDDGRSGEVKHINSFRNRMKVGDILIVSKGNKFFRAIGIVKGEYEYHPHPEGFNHRRSVDWIWVDNNGVPASDIIDRKFIRSTVYKLKKNSLNVPALERYMNSGNTDESSEPESFVLIIDEINRANISKVLGELITLLEPDKRLGQPNELKVRLPYSEDYFGVPANLHIIGTMNTADRSIALLDTALRRRFDFREMMPDASTLNAVDGIDLSKILTTMNERIKYLYDREHQIGHAYFTDCSSKADIDDVMRHKVIPLLSEYFFEDWAKVAAVLGDLKSGDGEIRGGFLNRSVLVAPPGLEGEETATRFDWQVRTEDEGFDYKKLLGA